MPHKRIIQYFTRLWEGRWKREHLNEPNHDDYVKAHVQIELKYYELEHSRQVLGVKEGSDVDLIKRKSFQVIPESNPADTLCIIDKLAGRS